MSIATSMTGEGGQEFLEWLGRSRGCAYGFHALYVAVDGRFWAWLRGRRVLRCWHCELVVVREPRRMRRYRLLSLARPFISGPPGYQRSREPS